MLILVNIEEGSNTESQHLQLLLLALIYAMVAIFGYIIFVFQTIFSIINTSKILSKMYCIWLNLLQNSHNNFAYLDLLFEEAYIYWSYVNWVLVTLQTIQLLSRKNSIHLKLLNMLQLIYPPTHLLPYEKYFNNLLNMKKIKISHFC